MAAKREPAFVEPQLQLSGARLPGMSLSSGEDEVFRVRAESLGAVALPDKTEFGHELIPAFCGWVRRARRRTPVQLPKDGHRRGFAGCGVL